MLFCWTLMRTRAEITKQWEPWFCTLYYLKVHSDRLWLLKCHIIVALIELHEFISLTQGWYKHLWCNLDHKESATNDECNMGREKSATGASGETSSTAESGQKGLRQRSKGRTLRGSRSWSERTRIPRAALSTTASSARARPGGSAARSSAACRGGEPQPAAGTAPGHSEHKRSMKNKRDIRAAVQLTFLSK